MDETTLGLMEVSQNAMKTLKYIDISVKITI